METNQRIQNHFLKCEWYFETVWVPTELPRRPDWASDPQVLELQVMTSLRVRAGMELGSFRRAASALELSLSRSMGSILKVIWVQEIGLPSVTLNGKPVIHVCLRKVLGP